MPSHHRPGTAAVFALPTRRLRHPHLPAPVLTGLLLLLAVLASPAPLLAQETDDDAFFEDPFAVGDEAEEDDGEETGDDDYDSLFEDEDMIDTADESEMIANPQDELLEQEGVRWGGRIRGSLTADWNWDDIWTSEFSATDPVSDSFTPTIGADLFFDARPDPEFRAYGKLEMDTTTDGGTPGFTLTADTLDSGTLPEGWTTEENDDGDIEIRDASGTLVTTIAGDEDTSEDEEDDEEPTTGTAPGLDITVFELFADYTWNDTLFFRFGKHTIKWGTGYFFSPADVLNLTAVDAEEPTADREGPVSLRALYPFGITGNAYLYVITNANADALDVAVAPKVEFVLGPGEVGLGGYYQRALAPRLVALYTATVGEVDLFGEAVLLWGSDRVFVRPSRDQSAAEADPDDELELVLDTYELDGGLFLQGTGGARYLKEWENGVSLALIGQYFFNGEGYADDQTGLLPAATRLLLNPDENGQAIPNPDDQPEGYEEPPALRFTDLSNWGRHYVGATASVSNLLVDDLSISAFALVNLSDYSGIITPAVTYRFLDRFSLGVSGRFTFGDSDDEYTDPAALVTGSDAAPTFGLTLDIAMPGGSF
jgi:hypothetical protein